MISAKEAYNMAAPKLDESKLKDMDAKRCLQELRNLGYAIRQLYRESQFVDTGLIIDWSKK